MSRRSTNPIQTLSNQLRKKGLDMVAEPVLDPAFGLVYTFKSVKPGMNNNDVAYRLYYAGEVAKWSPTRRKAIDRMTARTKKKEEERLEREASGSVSTSLSVSTGAITSDKGSGSGSE
ncbi:hypothetical protein G647_06768 [Cladophialophora carrionii CBS 160.54]|uniref:Uncharacterized protein n=1 Tax=Cladophialophora carrionii CBS 160.54 TaxID=1279043 RepID=V9D9P3_9EURO|nr:uncharacterized protein G647_06768 [Cladophialophora carrionii CBS 160.54]ETI22692.1 hypothetical protein G647_06768 [Cladophialophora carrionii CBS 160.54]